MTIDEAFEDMLKTKWLRLSEKNRRMWRSRFKSGKLTIDKKKQLLNKNGYSVIKPEEWGKA